MTGELFIGHIGFSVQSWLNYISAVGREYVLSEGSIKLPLAEFISTKLANASSVRLEYPHPAFAKKRMDFYYTLPSTSGSIEISFEFKYVKDGSTLPTSERQRIFNDLMRLYYFAKHSGGSKVYFLICGMQFEFIQAFQKIKETATPVTAFLPTVQGPVVNWSGFYTEWFSFDKNNTKKAIDLTTTDSTYSNIYGEFVAEYGPAYDKKMGTKMTFPTSIETRLVFLSDDNVHLNIPNPMKLGIWEVLVN